MNAVDNAYAKFEAATDPQHRWHHLTTYMMLRHDRSIDRLWFVIFVQLVMIVGLYAKIH